MRTHSWMSWLAGNRLIVRCNCHVERSRDISGCEGYAHRRGIRDSSTSLGMTQSGLAASAMIPRAIEQHANPKCCCHRRPNPHLRVDAMTVNGEDDQQNAHSVAAVCARSGELEAFAKREVHRAIALRQRFSAGSRTCYSLRRRRVLTGGAKSSPTIRANTCRVGVMHCALHQAKQLLNRRI